MGSRKTDQTNSKLNSRLSRIYSASRWAVFPQTDESCATSGSREGQSRRPGGLAFPAAAAAQALPRSACTGGCSDSRPAPSMCSRFIPPRRSAFKVHADNAWSSREPVPPRAFVAGASCRWVNGAEEIGEG